MLLKNLRLQNFRNLITGGVEFSPRLNLLIGHNGQGKTSLLEAVYVLGCTKSFRTHQTSEVIRHGATEAWISGAVQKGGLPRELAVGLFERGKKFLINRREESLLSYLGSLDVLAITSDQMPIVKGYPEERRRFMDRMITGLQPAYLPLALNYQRALRQKNALLRDMKEGRRQKDPEQIQAWNEELIDYGAKIVQARHRFVADLKARLSANPFNQEVIKAKYLPMPHVDLAAAELEAYRPALRTQLTNKLAEEITTGHTLVGPHRDELLLFINGKSLQKFGSAGQKRSVLLALNLACLEIFRQTTDEFPIVLIDDIDAELDPPRLQALLQYLSDKSQLFISTAKPDTVKEFLDQGHIYEMVAGEIRPISRAGIQGAVSTPSPVDWP